MPKHVSILLTALFAVSLAASDAAISVPTDQIKQAPVTRHASTDQITIPGLLSYQGKLLDSTGSPVPDSVWPVRFCLYTEPVGGTPYWSENQPVETRAGLFHVLLGSVTPVPSVPEFGDLFLGMKVGTDPEMEPRMHIVSAAYAFLADKADSAQYATEARPVGPAGGSLTGDYPGPTIAPNMVGTSELRNYAVTAPKLHQMGAGSGQVLKWNGSAWAPANDSIGSGGVGDNAWTRVGSDSVLFTVHKLGIARGGADNVLYGESTHTHVNLGVACTTGTSGQANTNCVVSGGSGNVASDDYATVGGGEGNTADEWYAAVGGGWYNTASKAFATVGGGEGNTASDVAASVGGGDHNTASGDRATVSGGLVNTASARYAFVGGGRDNTASGGVATFVGGGWNNTASGDFAFVGGGYDNTASDTDATVGGGYGNTASGNDAFVGGGEDNTASANKSFVGGGSANTASAIHAAVGGGSENTASGVHATVGGGLCDTASGPYATVGGGHGNTASDTGAFVGGGIGNTANRYFAAVAGGESNTASDTGAFVGGGYGNTASGNDAFVGGGHGNTASGEFATVAGGGYDTATAYGSAVGGGIGNTASANQTFVGGGYYNTASVIQAFVGGGNNNTASGNAATVGGGDYNTASAIDAFVGGGYHNLVDEDYGTIPGGYGDTCSGGYALAAGYKTRIRAGGLHTLAFGENCSTSVPRAVVFYHSGAATKLGVGVQTPTHNIDVQGGAYCTGTNWVNGSSRALKTDISTLTPAQMQAVLAELERTQVVKYRYKSEASGEQHIGLIAEDAPELLATPERDGINTADAIGWLVAIAKAQQAEIEALKAAQQRR